MMSDDLSEGQIESCITRLLGYCGLNGDNFSSSWLEQLLWASYAVVDALEGENLSERVSELGDLLPMRTAP